MRSLSLILIVLALALWPSGLASPLSNWPRANRGLASATARTRCPSASTAVTPAVAAAAAAQGASVLWGLPTQNALRRVASETSL